MRKLLNAVFALMFLAGFLLLVYPTIADQWNTYRQSRLISSYEETIAVMEPEDFSEEWEKAEAFNWRKIIYTGTYLPETARTWRIRNTGPC